MVNEKCLLVGNIQIKLYNDIKLKKDNVMSLRNQLKLLKIEIKKIKEEIEELEKRIQNENKNFF